MGVSLALSKMEYLPYGETWFEEGDTNNAPKYNSQELDKETGYYFYNARHYDPEISRFVTADNVIDGEGDTQGWNRFAYCKGNPIKYKDPTGHYTIQNKDRNSKNPDDKIYFVQLENGKEQTHYDVYMKYIPFGSLFYRKAVMDTEFLNTIFKNKNSHIAYNSRHNILKTIKSSVGDAISLIPEAKLIGKIGKQLVKKAIKNEYGISESKMEDFRGCILRPAGNTSLGEWESTLKHKDPKVLKAYMKVIDMLILKRYEELKKQTTIIQDGVVRDIKYKDYFIREKMRAYSETLQNTFEKEYKPLILEKYQADNNKNIK